MGSRMRQMVIVGTVALVGLGFLAGNAQAQLRRAPVGPRVMPNSTVFSYSSASPQSPIYQAAYYQAFQQNMLPYYGYGVYPTYYGPIYSVPSYSLYNPYVNPYPYSVRYRNIYNIYLVNPYGVYNPYYP